MIKLSEFVAALAWCSLFALIWLLILGRVDLSGMNLFFAVFLFLVGVISGLASVDTHGFRGRDDGRNSTK